MKIIWDESPLTAQEVMQKLKDGTKWSPKTVKTLLNRLVKKGALGFDKKGRIYHYYPKVSKSECRRFERHSFLSRVYDGALQPMLKAFISDRQLSPEEIQELKKILDQSGGTDR
jgi:BlaI family penicillinase repressor